MTALSTASTVVPSEGPQARARARHATRDTKELTVSCALRTTVWTQIIRAWFVELDGVTLPETTQQGQRLSAIVRLMSALWTIYVFRVPLVRLAKRKVM